MIDPNFYRTFEDRFRGSREVVKSRLGIYLPFLAPFKTIYDSPKALDIGCGRGEWLELLQEQGFQCIGVDADDAMLKECGERKLNTVHSDFMEWLKGVEPDSQSVVSAFHFVEHISFESLFELVKEALRVLKPGGLLILETQNSENLLVGASTFYIDPTHQRPIHPLQLSFIAEYLGFERIKTLYLQESPELSAAQHVNLFSVLVGVSPDYAVVAQKKATNEIASLFAPCFDHTYGLRLEELSSRYDRYVDARVKQEVDVRVKQEDDCKQWLRSEWSAAQAKVEALSHQSGSLQTEIQWLRNEWKAEQAKVTALSHQAATLSHQNDAFKTEIQSLLSSTSWRITAPLRKTGSLIKSFLRLKGQAKSKIKQLLMHAKLFINRRPRLKRIVLVVLMPFPALKRRLKQSTANGAYTMHAGNQSMADLSMRARRIYTDIKTAAANSSKRDD